MNRNEVYEYLKSQGLYPIARRHGKKKYHIEFVPNTENGQYEIYCAYFDWGSITHIRSIHLCVDSVIIEGKLSDVEIQVYYKDMDNFEICMDE